MHDFNLSKHIYDLKIKYCSIRVIWLLDHDRFVLLVNSQLTWELRDDL